MLNDFKAFLSYKKVYGRYVTLGNDTRLPLLGIGTAKFSLTGKVLIIRNALHVPGLRNPLYSLRSHKTMPGCGTFSHFDVGSFILFPDFMLRIDDHTDNIVSYKSIGRDLSTRLDYAQPRAARGTEIGRAHV